MAFTSFVASTTISASDMNANMAFMQGDFVPFDTAGTVTTNAFCLGTTTGIWKSAYVNSLNVGSINCSNTAIFNVDSQFSSTVKISGNVSIGHNNASQTLDVKGRTWFIASTGTWANVMDNNGENGYGLLVRGLKSQNTIFQASSSDTTLFIINGNGNSGFGWNNINPSQTLDVKGSLRVRDNTTDWIGSFVNSQSGGANGLSLDSSFSMSTLLLMRSSLTTLFRLEGSGNLGIGWNNNNPSQTLDVSGNIALTGLVTSGVGINTFGYTYCTSVQGLSIANGGTLDLTLAGSGFVGILYVENENASSATQRTARLYHITGRLDNGVTITQVFTADGGTAAWAFSITDNSSGSANIIRLTNNGGAVSNAIMSFVGMQF